MQGGGRKSHRAMPLGPYQMMSGAAVGSIRPVSQRGESRGRTESERVLGVWLTRATGGGGRTSEGVCLGVSWGIGLGVRDARGDTLSG
jgi:hypothetical protein